MTLRGRLSEVPKQIVADNKEAILKMYYDEGIKQQEIRKRLGLSSVSIIAEILRRDMLEKIESFKKIDPSSKNYELKLLEVIKFLKNQRKMDYSSIALALGLEKARVFKVISSENSGLRNSLSDSERRDRNAEMVRLSKEEGLSVTEIGKRMGVSKQMVSRIFTDLGYKPIRGTRNIQARMGNIPELRKFIIEDCNAKLKEMGAQLRKVKGDFASSRQYSARVIAELRCLYVCETAQHITLTNYHDFVTQCGFVKRIYNTFLSTTTEETRPPHFSTIENAVKVIESTVRKPAFKEIKKALNVKEK